MKKPTQSQSHGLIQALVLLLKLILPVGNKSCTEMIMMNIKFIVCAQHSD